MPDFVNSQNQSAGAGAWKLSSRTPVTVKSAKVLKLDLQQLIHTESLR